MVDNILFLAAGIVSLFTAARLSSQLPPGKPRPTGAHVFSLCSLILLSQAILMLVLSFAAPDDVTRPILFFLWLSGICACIASWMGKGDRGWDDWKDKDDLPPDPQDPALPPDHDLWQEFDQLRSSWDRPLARRG